MTILRPATPDDQAAIRSLIRQSQINPIGLNWHRFIVIVDERGRLLACGQIKPHRDGSRELASIAVAPDQRGKGLARSVIECLLEQAGPPLYLTCADRLRGFYERFGFRVLAVDEMPGYFRSIYRMFNWLARLVRSQRRLLVMGWLD